jgi:spermidine/putrescine-binding protein
MSGTSRIGVGRRNVLIGGAATAVAGGFLSRKARTAGEPLRFVTWSAAVDQVKSHLDGFTKKTGIQVDYSNTPRALVRTGYFGPTSLCECLP